VNRLLGIVLSLPGRALCLAGRHDLRPIEVPSGIRRYGERCNRELCRRRWRIEQETGARVELRRGWEPKER
jgi:hypothetical protein